MTITAQITAKVKPELKRDFMKAAKKYDVPASSLLAMFMRMVVAGQFMPAIQQVQPEDTHAAFYEHKDMIAVGEPIENVIATLSRMQ